MYSPLALIAIQSPIFDMMPCRLPRVLNARKSSHIVYLRDRNYTRTAAEMVQLLLAFQRTQCFGEHT